MVRVLLVFFALCSFSGAVRAIEEPDFDLIDKAGDYELRAYAPMIVAETIASGSIDDATRAGFKVIADFIFGNNQSRAGDSEEISMTAPVTVAPQSEQIEMTAPVTMEKVDGEWRVHFVMPAEYSMETLPRPNNNAVTLREVAPRNYAVIRFSGFTGEEKVAGKTAKLRQWMEEKGLQPQGAPQLARYNHPLTLPFMRRNEVLIPY